jgi:hypothetical protein
MAEAAAAAKKAMEVAAKNMPHSNPRASMHMRRRRSAACSRVSASRVAVYTHTRTPTPALGSLRRRGLPPPPPPQEGQGGGAIPAAHKACLGCSDRPPHACGLLGGGGSPESRGGGGGGGGAIPAVHEACGNRRSRGRCIPLPVCCISALRGLSAFIACCK